MDIMVDGLVIRAAEEIDFPAITAIYNEVLLNSTAIYREEPVSIEERLAWWRSRRQQSYPTLVAFEEGFSGSGFRSTFHQPRYLLTTG